MDDYAERKFRRFMRQAQHASVYERWHGRHNGYVYDVEIRRAARSKGYQSNYEPVMVYWLFSYRNGERLWAKTATPKVYEALCKDLLKHGLVSVKV